MFQAQCNFCSAVRQALFARLKRSGLDTKVHKLILWDTGKNESVLIDFMACIFPFHACTEHRTVLTRVLQSSALLLGQNMHIGKWRGKHSSFKEIMHFLLLFSQTETSFFLFAEAAFQSSEIWLVLVTRAVTVRKPVTGHCWACHNTQGQVAFS